MPVGHSLLADTKAWWGVAQCQLGHGAEVEHSLAAALTIRKTAVGDGAFSTLDVHASLAACRIEVASQSEPIPPPLSAAERLAWISARGAEHRLARWYLSRTLQQTSARLPDRTATRSRGFLSR